MRGKKYNENTYHLHIADGLTKKYAQWLADKVSGDLMDLKEAKKKRDDFLKAMMRSCLWRLGYGREDSESKVVS